MLSIRPLVRVFSYLTAGVALAVAQSNPQPLDPPKDPQTEAGSWLDKLLQFKLPKFPGVTPVSFGVQSSTCSVAPLASIEEPGAISFETHADTAAVVDTSGLTSATATALAKLEDLVAKIGGHVELKSAYRPPAYQEHLQEVWDKYKTLKRNRQPGCQALRTEIAEEFTRHHLLETQRPVNNSDHTRGVAVDAALVLPAGARVNRRRISLDKLAKMVGFMRPDIRRDPVHYRLLAARRDDPPAILSTN